MQPGDHTPNYTSLTDVTCINFGQDVLTHPLMVELIADHFIPVAIFNNHPGKDAEILRRFGEPSWNNPVVRFLGPDGAERERDDSGARTQRAFEHDHRRFPFYRT